MPDEESRCPLCGGDNNCAMADGGRAAQCWCAGAVLDSEALAAIPPAAVGKYCICSVCGTPAGEARDDR